MVNQIKTKIAVLQLVLLLGLISVVSSQSENTSEMEMGNTDTTTNPTETIDNNSNGSNTPTLDQLIPIQNNTVPFTLQINIPSGNSNEVSWEEKSYYLPQAIQILGQASGSLVSDQVVIDFNVETLDKLAGTSLNLNNEIIQNSVNILLEEILQPTEISTQGVSIQKQVKYVYNNGTGQWDQVFEGYRVNNRLKITTDKVDQAGQIIDIAVANGIDQIDSVQFLPLASNIKELQDSLITQAVEDATNKAHLALLPLGYEVCGVKSVNIIDNTNSGQYMKARPTSEASVSDSSLLTSTPLFSGRSQFTVEVSVQFLITKSEVDVLVSPPAS